MVKLTLYGNPVTKKNSQQILRKVVGKGINKKTVPFIAPSKAFAKYQDNCLQSVIGFKNSQINYKCNVKCIYYMKMDYEKVKSKIDLGNLLAATCDVLAHYGVLAEDNSRIVAGHDGSRVLHDKENPRVEIYIERWTNEL